MENKMTNQLAKFDNNQLLSLMDKMSHLTEEDKKNLEFQIVSNDIELRNKALDSMRKSMEAQGDIANVMHAILEAPKKGMYVNSTQEAELASGKVTITVKGGDTKFIIPVLVILAIVALIVLFVVFE